MDLKKILRRTRIKLKAIRLPKKKHKLDNTFDDDIPLYQSNKPICPYGRTCALISDSKQARPTQKDPSTMGRNRAEDPMDNRALKGLEGAKRGAVGIFPLQPAGKRSWVCEY